MRRALTVSVTTLALAVAACGVDENTTSSDQQAVLQSLAASATAWTEESPGTDGATMDVAGAALAEAITAAPGDTFQPPAFWGRIRRAHTPSRSRIVIIEGDTARVSVAVTFDGVLRVDTTHDGIMNAGSKPLLETARQHALLVRDSAAANGWRLVAISPRRFQNTAPDERTVNIVSVRISRNGDAPKILTDPEALLSTGALSSIDVGDTLSVEVKVINTTGTALVPPTQMFIHVRHLQPGSDAWGRFPMHRQDDSTFRARWIVHRAGAGIVAVDALDSETLMTESADDYRSELWAVPLVVN